MSDERTSDFAIDEFKALRDEVKRCESESLSITLYTFTAVVLAAGLAEKSGLPKQAIPILIQVALLWGMHRYYALISLGMRLSTYIQVMLEPVLPGIRWEGRNKSFEDIYTKIRYFSSARVNWSLQRFSQVFFLLTAIGLYVSINAALQIQTRDFGFYVFAVVLVILHLMSTLLMLKCVFLRPTAARFEGIWQSIKQREQ
jgi:hypothetical protein